MSLEFLDNPEYRSLAGWIIVVQAVGASIGLLLRGQIKKWYKNLHHSRVTPPSFLAPVVWTILYTLIAIAGWKLERQAATPQLTLIRILFGAQLILNWIWSVAFFKFHRTDISFGIVFIKVIVVWALVYLSFDNKIDDVAWLMLPLLCWLCFATYLNYFIWRNNSQEKEKDQ